MRAASSRPAPATRFPIKKTSARGPISKGKVKQAQPKGFPKETSSAYRKPSRVTVPKTGAK